MIKDTILAFCKENKDVELPSTYIAQECECTPTYVVYLAKKLNFEIIRKNYGKIYIKYKGESICKAPAPNAEIAANISQ